MTESTFESAKLLYEDSDFALIAIDTKTLSVDQHTADEQHSFLMGQLTKMVPSSTLCDLTITCHNKRAYKIHSVVLSLHSKNYCNQLVNADSSTTNKRPLSIELVGDDINAEAVEEVIEYLYTGNTILNDNLIANVFSIGIQLAIDSLIEKCTSYFRNYNCNNVVEYIQIISGHENFKELHQNMLDYANKYSKAALDNRNYLNISAHDLSTIIANNVDSQPDACLHRLLKVIKWIEVDKEKRKQHANVLLRAVDLTNLAPKDICEFVEGRPDLFPYDDCVDVLLTAYKFHISFRVKEDPEATSLIAK